MNYEDNIGLLNEEDFFHLFSAIGAEPRVVSAGGHKSFQIIGLCHHSQGNHSAVFDPESLKVTCYSQCGRGMLLHTYIKEALNFDYAEQAKEFLLDFIENQNIDLTDRINKNLDFQFSARKFLPSVINPVTAIPAEILAEIYSELDTSLETLSKLVWSTSEQISGQLMKDVGIGYYPKNGTIILPHMNYEGDICGFYERSFKPLRKQVKKEHPEMSFQELVRYPRAKYVPLLRKEKWQDENKTSWSFPNGKNLYNLNRSKNFIKESGEVIVFEGAKSCLKAEQWGFKNTVCTHTFGIGFDQLSLLIQHGAKNIVLGFDKQYKDMEGKEFELFLHKTKGIAEQVKDYCRVFWLVDDSSLLSYKSAPVDHSLDIFLHLLEKKRSLEDDEPRVQEGVSGGLTEEQIKKIALRDAAREYEQYFTV